MKEKGRRGWGDLAILPAPVIQLISRLVHTNKLWIGKIVKMVGGHFVGAAEGGKKCAPFCPHFLASNVGKAVLPICVTKVIGGLMNGEIMSCDY